MAKFLNTSATNYFVEELIKTAADRLILISPFLKLNERVKELLTDKDRLKMDVRVVYGKTELHAQEIDWFSSLTYVRTSFCKNLHAKCYLNEEVCVVTSLNLYEFSQVNNHEMGILIRRSEDPDLYRDVCEEALRIIRISDEVHISRERMVCEANANDETEGVGDNDEKSTGKLASSKLSKRLGIPTKELMSLAVQSGHLDLSDGKHILTEKGKNSGIEFVSKSRYGPYFLWPEGFQPPGPQ